MRITLGCKRWSRNQQYGFRIYAPDILRLGSILVYPSSDNKWDSFDQFREQVIAGNHPEAYSRSVVISDSESRINVNATFATHGRTFQGYITAPLNTWLLDYVTSRMGLDLKCEYLVHASQDIILIPAKVKSVYDELDKKDKAGKRKVRKLLKKSQGTIPQQNAIEIGLYFEVLESERLKSEYPESSHQVFHRYPAINSSINLLKQNNISCDIDVATKSGAIVKCVEVKAISMSEETPFNLTIREWNSRVWCRKQKLPYEIVVYYHFRYQVIKRIVIKMADKLKRIPSGYYCYPSGL
ncbi:hypothetical protein [Dehalococcoides mccartyi]|uniref:hypothetical protein n=1 Tax=Dehalococcoides mccartyi TaxID=61435 RepID=UPI001AF26B7A|nr:hypothetical protein [Dehalococcoides mccartyi]BCT55302.1 hypothetical protein DHCNIT_000650 [Dehalococcoides mccartyi]